MKTFQKLQKDLGMEVALESFRKVLAVIEEDIFHDPCHGSFSPSSSDI